MGKEQVILVDEDRNEWLATREIVERIKKRETFEFNARLNQRPDGDDSFYLRLSSTDKRIDVDKYKMKRVID